MRLYSFQHSPNPLKVRFALAELGVAHQIHEVNLFKGEHRAPDFTAVNPHRKVPVLEDGDVVITESNAILAYLGQTRGGALWPTDAAGQARALRWMFFESFSMGNQCGTLWWTDVVSKHVGRPGADEVIVKEHVEELERSLGVLDAHLGSRAFLLGDFTLADCSVGVALAMLRGTRLDDAARWPHAVAYRERLRARPAWTAANGEAIHQFG